eukprot:3239507-Prymnesium_polylepis.1
MRQIQQIQQIQQTQQMQHRRDTVPPRITPPYQKYSSTLPGQYGYSADTARYSRHTVYRRGSANLLPAAARSILACELYPADGGSTYVHGNEVLPMYMARGD